MKKLIVNHWILTFSSQNLLNSLIKCTLRNKLVNSSKSIPKSANKHNLTILTLLSNTTLRNIRTINPAITKVTEQVKTFFFKVFFSYYFRHNQLTPLFH